MKRALSLALVLLAFAACERVTEPVSGPLVVPLPLFDFAAGACGTERPITTDAAYRDFPAISGDRIVWQDARNGNWDIYLFDLATGTEQQITTDPAHQYSPAISGDRIVWEDLRNGNWDIYLFDLATGTEQQITTDPTDQRNPAIDGDRIVYADDRNGNRDIYLFDLATGTEQPVTTDPWWQDDPAIFGDRIVWTHSHDFDHAIYFFDLATGTGQLITTMDAKVRGAPAIFGDRIVWDQFDPTSDIYLFDLATGTEQRITMGPNSHSVPAVSGDRIVWADNRNGNFDIYLFDLATGTEQQVTTDPGFQYHPAISGARIVWADGRAEMDDIYLADLSAADATPPTITPPPDVSAGNDPGLASATVNPGAATATDGCSNVVVLASRSDGLALGDPYPVGVTTIIWTATDDSGNSASAEQRVTVVDAEAPAVSVPDDFAADATGPGGATVPYTATATDNVGVTTFGCTPVSGALLAIGTHTVSCSAADATGNSASASFMVTVNGAEEQVTDLQDDVTGLDLQEGTETSLQQKLAAAQAALAGGQQGAACNQLQALINQVAAQVGKKITAEDAAILIAEAERIRAVLGC